MTKYATITILGLFLVLVGINWSRFARDTGEPALLREPSGVWVQLGHGFSVSETVRQFNDDCLLVHVIKLTEYSVAAGVNSIIEEQTPVESGQRIDLIVQETEIQSISFSWMSASQRVVLGIRLHPDRMTPKDWEFLPGVGAKMAARIEDNRQNNGDFGSFSALRRIKGVGARKMAAWKEFF